MLMSSVADSLSPIMIRIIESSEFVSESAVGEIYKERKIKGNGTLRKVKSLSELNIDEMLDRLHEKSRSFTTDIAAKFHEKVRRIEERNFKTDVRLLRWMFQNTRPRIWLIGGGSLVEGDESYLRVGSCSIHQGKAQKVTSLSRRRGTFYTDVKSYRGGILVIGGESHNSIGTLEIYDPVQDKWAFLPDLPERLQYCSSVVDKDNLFISGGLNHSIGGCSGDMYRFCYSDKK